ncbi:MAG: NlpC/P60 family protein [Pseudomonadota bacterium]
MENQLYPDRRALTDAWLKSARRWLGTPYRHQASKHQIGADCIGLVAGVWRDVYANAPSYKANYSKDWAEVGAEDRILAACELHCERRKSLDAEAGDLLVFRMRSEALAKHIGIASSSIQMIHAIERHAVQEVPISSWWRRRLVGVFRPPLNFPKA